MSDGSLTRFLEAQSSTYADALAELTAGKKTSHWMWFVFPQLKGLGRSTRAHHYGLDGLDEAGRYLGHPVLGPRLRDCVTAMLTHRNRSAWDILGSPDNWKFKSCLTLFETVASTDTDRALFAEALNHFYDGERDALTLSLLGVSLLGVSLVDDDADAEVEPGPGPSIEGAVRNPTTGQIVAMIQASSERAARRIICERTGDVWCWPAEQASHADGARRLGAVYTGPPFGEILTVDD